MWAAGTANGLDHRWPWRCQGSMVSCKMPAHTSTCWDGPLTSWIYKIIDINCTISSHFHPNLKGKKKRFSLRPIPTIHPCTLEHFSWKPHSFSGKACARLQHPEVASPPRTNRYLSPVAGDVFLRWDFFNADENDADYSMPINPWDWAWNSSSGTIVWSKAHAIYCEHVHLTQIYIYMYVYIYIYTQI